MLIYPIEAPQGMQGSCQRRLLFRLELTSLAVHHGQTRPLEGKSSTSTSMQGPAQAPAGHARPLYSTKAHAEGT